MRCCDIAAHHLRVNYSAGFLCRAYDNGREASAARHLTELGQVGPMDVTDVETKQPPPVVEVEPAGVKDAASSCALLTSCDFIVRV